MALGVRAEPVPPARRAVKTFLGRGEVARRGTLDPVFGGSNPPAPTTPRQRGGVTDHMPYELKLFTGNAHRPLAEEIAASLGIPVGQAEVSRFSDGEIFVQIDENVRGADVFLVQPTCPP